MFATLERKCRKISSHSKLESFEHRQEHTPSICCCSICLFFGRKLTTANSWTILDESSARLIVSRLEREVEALTCNDVHQRHSCRRNVDNVALCLSESARFKVEHSIHAMSLKSMQA